MKKEKDEFYFLNKTKKKGNGILIFVAVVAICITGILYAAKLQSDSKYVILETKNTDISISETI